MYTEEALNDVKPGGYVDVTNTEALTRTIDGSIYMTR